MLDEAIADAEASIRSGRGTQVAPFPAMLSLGWLLYEKQEIRRALAMFTQLERETDRPGVKGWTFSARRGIVAASLALGERQRAAQAHARQRALLQEARDWPVFQEFNSRWSAQVEATATILSFAEQEFERAEASAQRAEQLFRRNANIRGTGPEERDNYLRAADTMLSFQGRAKLNQGRLAEAENDYRSAAVSRIRNGGKYQIVVADIIAGLGYVKFLQAENEQALEISNRVFDIFNTMNLSKSSVRWVRNMNSRAWVFTRLNRAEDVAQSYAQVDAATENWSDEFKQSARTPPHRISWMINTSRSAEGINIAKQALTRVTARFGDEHTATAITRVNYATMLGRTGQIADALSEFRKALPVLFDNAAEEKDDIDSGGTAGLDQPTRFAVVNYLVTIAAHTERTQADIEEAFRYAERARGDSVQRALLAASGRASLRNPQLAPLVRREQDAEKQITAAVDALRAALTAPPEQRNPQNINALRAEVVNLRRNRASIQQEIARRAPNYAELMRPEPPSIAQLQAVMQPGEVYLSIYVAELSTFIWAIPKEGDVQFARAPLGRVRVGELVNRVRNSLTIGGASLLDIPDFDVEASAQLYQEILKPVETTLNKGTKLLVAANGTLAGLPFGLLAKEAPALDLSGDPMFDAYRRVPWLIRSHSITMLPSAATLRSLRTAANGAPGRQPFIGFGDPFFNREQSTDLGRPVEPAPSGELSTRGGRGAVRLALRNLPKPSGVDQASFGQLQRLPDTADELISIARALGSDPARSVILHKDANERRVKEMNLASYRVVAFATHGLTPGELPGLRLPALALTAPEVAGVDGDGLLAIDEVLQLKLDADWVILSACNTGSGLGEGAAAEAATGLGRAFFFAGSKALLVTGWAVHSASARDLVTDVFSRQTSRPDMSRSEALQQAMINVMDTGVIRDPAGGVVATYSHPVFWAPYILIGEGGATR